MLELIQTCQDVSIAIKHFSRGRYKLSLGLPSLTPPALISNFYYLKVISVGGGGGKMSFLGETTLVPSPFRFLRLWSRLCLDFLKLVNRLLKLLQKSEIKPLFKFKRGILGLIKTIQDYVQTLQDTLKPYYDSLEGSKTLRRLLERLIIPLQDSL